FNPLTQRWCVFITNRPEEDQLVRMCGHIYSPIHSAKLLKVAREVPHSHSALPKFRLFAFSETARFTWSVAPSGKSSEISTLTLIEAFGSLFKMAIISSAICTRRNLAADEATSADP